MEVARHVPRKHFLGGLITPARRVHCLSMSVPRRIYPPLPEGFSYPENPDERWLMFKLAKTCASLQIPWTAEEHTLRGLYAHLMALAAPEQKARVRKALELETCPDGTPYQNFAARPLFTPRNCTAKNTIFQGWPVPFPDVAEGVFRSVLDA